MQEIVTFGPNATKLLRKGTDAVMETGDLITQPGKITYGTKLDVSLNVTSTGVVAGFTGPQRDAVLDALVFTFTLWAKLANKIDVFEKDSLLTLRADAERMLRRDWEGVEDNTTGLAAAYVAGNNVRTFSAYIPLSYADAVKQARKLFGLGYEQLLLSRCLLKLDSDPFRAVSNLLTLADSSVTFSPLWESGHKMFVGMPFVAKEYVAPEKKDISTDAGLHISVEQMTPLADTDLEEVTVGVGPGKDLTKRESLTITAEENPPAVIQAQYERMDGVKDSTVEQGIKSSRTLVYGIGDTDFAQLRTGYVTAAQKKLKEPWKLRACFMPYMSTDALYEYVQAVANTLPPGEQVLAVNAATYDGIDANEAQLPFSGIVFLTTKDADFFDRVGVRGVSGGEVVEVYIPPDQGRQFARLALDAMEPSTTYPNGDTGKVKSLRERYLWGCPGLVNHPNGLAYTSTVAKEGNAKLSEYLAEAEQKKRQVQALADRLNGTPASTNNQGKGANAKAAAAPRK